MFGCSSEVRQKGASRAGAMLCAATTAALLASLTACSSSSGTRLGQPGGAPAQQTSQQTAQQGQPQAWRQPSQFDADGPPSGTYRGGRDPVTGKAQEWSPNSSVETSAITPMPSPGRPQPVARNAPAQQPQATGSGIGILGKVKVRQGDTLESIAHAHGITVTALMQANRMTGRGSLKVGQQLVVPQ